MTLEETAKYLKIGKSTLYKMTMPTLRTKNDIHPGRGICEQFGYEQVI